MDNTAFHNAFQEFISRKGMNATAQRRIIAEVFFRFPGHHSLEEFYQRVQQQDASIGQTTVYRTLKLLCEAGLAMEIHFSDGIARYELAASDSHHDHMVCVTCGKIIEIYDPRIEKIQHELARKYGFLLRGHVHNLYGVCADCAARELSGPEDGDACERAEAASE